MIILTLSADRCCSIQSARDSESSRSESIASKPGTHALELRDVFKLLHPVASDWQNIGTLLGIDESSLSTIRANENNKVISCLREMLSLWLKQSSPRPTWEALSDAVKPFDATISKMCIDHAEC